MTPSSSAVRLLTVEDSFDIKGLGVVLAPEVDHALADQFAGATHIAEANRPDGTRIEVEIWVGWQHFNPGGFRCMVTAKSATKAELPIGTELWCDRTSGEPSRAEGTLDEPDRR